MAIKIQLRRDTATAWSTSNPVLSQGEAGFDITNNILKIGNGTSNWNDLPAVTGGGIGSQGIQGFQGVQGTGGIQGLQGVQGTNGNAGAQGNQGIQGSQGIQGISGSFAGQGIQGVQGPAGAVGGVGVQGLQGATGPAGGPISPTGNTFYVTKEGDNDNDGLTIGSAFATIKYALSQAVLGETIEVGSGIYTEEYPLNVPPGVTLHGAGIRATTIRPTLGTDTNDGFLINGTVTFSDFTMKGQYWDEDNETGYAFRINPGAEYSERSPYIQRVSILYKGRNTVGATDPYGFNSAGNLNTAGRGFYADGAVIASASVQNAILLNEVTMIVPNSIGIYLTNGTRCEALNTFCYFADRAVYLESGTLGRNSNGETKIRISGTSIGYTPSPGNTMRIEYADSTVIEEQIYSYENGTQMIVFQGKVDNLIEAPALIEFYNNETLIATATEVTFVDYKDFGAEFRAIGNAYVYGNYGIYCDGVGIQANHIGQNFAYVGSGKDFSNDPDLTIQANEVVAINGAKVYINSINEIGDLRFGDANAAWLLDASGRFTAAGDIIPDTDNLYNLGSPTHQWRDIFVSDGSIYIGDVKLSNDNGTLLVQQVTDAGLETETPVPDAPGSVTTNKLVNGQNQVVLNSNGDLTLPEGGDILDSEGNSVLGGGTISVGDGAGPSVQNVSEILFNGTVLEIAPNVVSVNIDNSSLTDDREVKVTVGNTEYFAIVNRVNADGDDGVKSSGVAYDSEGNMIALHVAELYISSTDSNIDRLFISKFDSVGELLWQKQIEEDVDVESDHDLVIDANDNIIVAVSKDRPGPDTIVIIKFDSDGVVLWQKDYAGTVAVEVTDGVDLDSDTVDVGSFNDNTVDVVTLQGDWLSPFNWDLQASSDGGENWVTLGTSVGNTYDFNNNVTQYYFPQGSIETLDSANNIYRLRGNIVNSSLEVTAMALSGTDIVVAAEYVENTSVPDTNIGLLMKVSSTGVLQWAQTFEVEAPTNPYGMDVGADGDIVVVGVAEPDGLPNAAFAQKFDGDTGAAVWTNILFGPYAQNNNEYAGGDVVIDSQNNIFITVNSRQPIVHEDGNSYEVTVSHVMKLNSAGATQWCRRIGPGPCASVATGIDCDDQGNVYLAALTMVQNNPVRDVNEFFDSARNVLAVAKYSTAGAVLWQRYIESDFYFFYPDDDTTFPGSFDATTSRGRNMSIGPNGKLAIQVSARNRDPDDNTENSTYWESITFQIDQDGREMTVGSGNEKFTVKASRIPGRFITIPEQLAPGSSTDFAENLAVTTATLTFADAELAQQIVRSAPYEYVFGNDGTLTIPNDGDIRLTQTQIGWFSIFGPANNDSDNIWIRANCVDTSTGDVYVVGQDDGNGQGFVARYNSQGEILWSIRLYDDNNGYGTRCNAVKIHPVNGNVVVLLEYFGNETGVLIVQIDPDTARIESEVGFRDLGENSSVNAYDFEFIDTGDSTISAVVVVGRKYDEWKPTPVTPLVGSTIGTIVAANASLPAGLDTGWRVSGTDITGRVDIQYFNRFENLTSTVREGSGAQFQVVSAGNGFEYVSALATVPNKGSNYLVGHKIKILGTDLGGATPANDAILEVIEIGEGGSIEGVTVSGTAGDGEEGGTYNFLTGTNYNVGSGFAFSDFYTPYESGQTYSDNGGYVLSSGGTNYVVGDIITISGTQLGGTTPANDMTLTVTDAPGGSVNNWTYAGTPQLTNRKITVDSVVDFGDTGSWNLDQPLGGEAFVAVCGGETFALQWTNVLSAGGENDTERYLSVAVDGNNNIYAAGEMIARNNAAGGDLNSYWCAVVSKFNSSGTHLWTRAVNDSLNDCYAKSVAVRGNDIVVTHENSNNSDTVVTKLDGTGAVKWQRTTNSGDDSSVAIDVTGDIYVVAEANMESDYGNCVKVIKFNSAGEIAWRKILATQLRGYDNTSEYFKNGRNLTLDTDHLYISGYTTAYDDNYENGFLVKIPKSGDQDGVYDVWVIQQDTYDVDKITSTEATAFTPLVGTGEFELWEPDFSSEWWDPSDNDYYHTLVEMRDRDGGAIEFADGTRQTTSAQQIPQIKISNGADHRLCLDDMGKHIYVTNSNTRIAVPYHQSDALPVGYTVVLINNSGNSISIDADGGGIDIVVPGVDTAQYWDLASPGMATLIKVSEYTWFMTGNVTVD